MEKQPVTGFSKCLKVPSREHMLEMGNGYKLFIDPQAHTARIEIQKPETKKFNATAPTLAEAIKGALPVKVAELITLLPLDTRSPRIKEFLRIRMNHYEEIKSALELAIPIIQATACSISANCNTEIWLSIGSESQTIHYHIVVSVSSGQCSITSINKA
jgi:hypothetical protein